MALTKVRVPVASISKIDSGTSNVNIASAGADITNTVAGTLISTTSPTGVVYPATMRVTTPLITSEDVTLATTAGATARVKTTATKLQVGTTSAHVTELLANAIVALTLETGGKVQLPVEGTAANHLVTKAYVDAAAASASAITATLATTGTISIPNSTGTNFIIKWGVTNGSGVLTQVTFAAAFPNAIFVALAVPLHNSTANSDGWFGVYNKLTTGFQINQANRGGSTYPWQWVALGF